MPRTNRGGPELTTRDHPNATKSAITATSITRSPARGTQQRAADRRQGGPRNRQQVPIAPASVFGPAGRRRCWWYTYRYLTSGTNLFGRARSPGDVTGERKAGCDHRVPVMAARTDSQPEPGAAA
jgi:hypothetical protein